MINRIGVITIAAALLSLTSAATAEGVAERLVTLGGSVTEIAVTLGIADRIVAVDDSSTYPPAAIEGKPRVGYYRTLSTEAVLSLRPDMVIAAAGAGPPVALERLVNAGVEVASVPEVRDLDDLVAAAGIIGTAVGRSAEAERLVASLTSDMAGVAAAVDSISGTPRSVFLLSLQRGSLMLAGRGTAADSLIALAGAENLAQGFAGYKPASPETLLTLQPDVIITTARTIAAAGDKTALLRQPGLEATPAGRGSRVIVLDDLLALGFGPRLPEAVNQLASGLYPDWESRLR